MGQPALVTLTTDFGSGSSYVAAMKGSLLAVNSQATILDLTHDLPPQDLIVASYYLFDALQYFPERTIHVVVVDPGVGTDRALLCIEWNDQHVLVPDNGCWTQLESLAKSPVRVYRLTQERYWRAPVSTTFHGRDILAPVAGHLSNGVSPADLGEVVESWVRLGLPTPIDSDGAIRGQVVVVDRFGNLISNISIRRDQVAKMVRIGTVKVPRFVRTYGDAEPCDLVALISSSGRIEIAEVNGSAANRLQLGVGAVVEVTVD